MFHHLWLYPSISARPICISIARYRGAALCGVIDVDLVTVVISNFILN